MLLSGFFVAIHPTVIVTEAQQFDITKNEEGKLYRLPEKTDNFMIIFLRKKGFKLPNFGSLRITTHTSGSNCKGQPSISLRHCIKGKLINIRRNDVKLDNVCCWLLMFTALPYQLNFCFLSLRFGIFSFLPLTDAQFTLFDNSNKLKRVFIF